MIEDLLNKIPLTITKFIDVDCPYCHNKHQKRIEYNFKINLLQIDNKKRYQMYYETSQIFSGTNEKSTGRATFNRVKLHRFITNCPKGKEVDHINHNGLDNRKSNLRVCSRLENMHNKLMYKNNKSGYRNINWNKCNKVWVVQVKRNGINTVVGTTTNLDKAVSMRDKYLKQLLDIQEVE